MVPNVFLNDGEIWLEVQGHERVRVRDALALEAALREVGEQHSVDGGWVLMAESSTPFVHMVRLMDAARSAGFHAVNLAQSYP